MDTTISLIFFYFTLQLSHKYMKGVRNMKRIVLAFIFLAFMAGCGKKEVARVDDIAIYQSDVDAQVKKLDKNIVKKYGIETVKKYILNSLIDEKLIQKEIDATNFANNPDVKKEWEKTKEDVYLGYFINKYIPEKAPVPEEKLKKEYENEKITFKKPEEVRASHILIMTGKKHSDAEAKKKAEEIIKMIKKDGSNFAELAKKYSEGPSKTKGGDLGFFTKNRMIKPLADVAFALKKGEFSKTPVKTRFGYHIIMTTDKKPASYTPFKDVEKSLRSKLYIDMLKKEYGMRLFPERISQKEKKTVIAEIKKMKIKYSNEDFIKELEKYISKDQISMFFKNKKSLDMALKQFIFKKIYLDKIKTLKLAETEDFKEYIAKAKNAFLTDQFKTKVIFKDIKITDDEVRNYYMQNKQFMDSLVKQFGKRILTDRKFRAEKEKMFLPYLKRQLENQKKQQVYQVFISKLKSKHTVKIEAKYAKTA